jgi:hypothetical protein
MRLAFLQRMRLRKRFLISFLALIYGPGSHYNVMLFVKIAGCISEDPEFESRQGVRFFRDFINCSAVVITLYALSLCVLEKK